METGLLVNRLAEWIQEKIRAAGCKGVVLGLSGGIDSSVVAALCIRVFPKNTLGIILPCHSVHFANGTLEDGSCQGFTEGKTIFRPLDYDWGEGYYEMILTTNSNSLTNGEVNYWIDDKAGQ